MTDNRQYPLASGLHGKLNIIKNCSIDIPGAMKIEFLSLPIITDSKGAKYDPAPVIGRATPILTYASSETRQISLDLPFITLATKSYTYYSRPWPKPRTGLEPQPRIFIEENKQSPPQIGTIEYNKQALRAIASAVYPRGASEGCPYLPPPVCLLKFGSFLWEDKNENWMNFGEGKRGEGVCAVLDKYNVKNDPAVPSDPDTLVPYKFIISTNWTVVYSSDDLPNSQLIYKWGK